MMPMGPIPAMIRAQLRGAAEKLLGFTRPVASALAALKPTVEMGKQAEIQGWIDSLRAAANAGTVVDIFGEDDFRMNADVAVAFAGAETFLAEKRAAAVRGLFDVLGFAVFMSAYVRMADQSSKLATAHDHEARQLAQTIFVLMSLTGRSRDSASQTARHRSVAALKSWLERSPLEYDQRLAPPFLAIATRMVDRQ